MSQKMTCVRNDEDGADMDEKEEDKMTMRGLERKTERNQRKEERRKGKWNERKWGKSK